LTKDRWPPYSSVVGVANFSAIGLTTGFLNRVSEVRVLLGALTSKGTSSFAFAVRSRDGEPRPIDGPVLAPENRAMFELFKFLHIFSMFVAVTLLFSPDILFYRAARARDVATMRRIGSLGKLVVNAGILLFFTGLGLGFLTALVGNFDITAPWLVTAYVLVGLIIILGAAVENPHFIKISAAAERSGERFSPELERLVGSPIKYLGWVSVALYGAVIYTMVAKPFGS
jgi:uncharacterized membrane protein SirB2